MCNRSSVLHSNSLIHYVLVTKHYHHLPKSHPGCCQPLLIFVCNMRNLLNATSLGIPDKYRRDCKVQTYPRNYSHEYLLPHYRVYLRIVVHMSIHSRSNEIEKMYNSHTRHFDLQNKVSLQLYQTAHILTKNCHSSAMHTRHLCSFHRPRYHQLKLLLHHNNFANFLASTRWRCYGGDGYFFKPFDKLYLHLGGTYLIDLNDNNKYALLADVALGYKAYVWNNWFFRIAPGVSYQSPNHPVISDEVLYKIDVGQVSAFR